MEKTLLTFLFSALLIFVVKGQDESYVEFEDNPLLSAERVEHINSIDGIKWTATTENFHRKTPTKFLKKLCGVLPDPDGTHNKLPKRRHTLSGLRLPSNFDGRIKWRNCPSFKEIRDQGSCGSCWAFAATEAMTDRYCVEYFRKYGKKSTGKKLHHFSAENLLSCCSECGMGCNGGFPASAFRYWKESGIVSGGPYNSNRGCQPYEIAPCEHHISGSRPNCTGDEGSTPKCENYCESSYHVSYENDLKRAKSAYSLDREPEQIQMDIMKHGSVEAAFTVYSDFPLYKRGVYHHVHGTPLGGHAVKIVGWGEEAGVPYWIVANSWNYDWGEGGFFKILRGRDECGIESSIVAGIPHVS